MEDFEKRQLLEQLEIARNNQHVLAYWIEANVFRDGADCTNGGASSKFNRIYIFSDRLTIHAARLDVEQRGLPMKQCFIVCTREIGDIISKHLRPMDPELAGKWTMMGGNFAYTCDSRYEEVTGCLYPLPIHDRIEA